VGRMSVPEMGGRDICNRKRASQNVIVVGSKCFQLCESAITSYSLRWYIVTQTATSVAKHRKKTRDKKYVTHGTKEPLDPKGL
jgi:hypothetical protein